MKIQESNRGYTKRVERDDTAKKLQKSENLFKLNSTPFRHMGRKNKRNNGRKHKRSAFKNIK